MKKLTLNETLAEMNARQLASHPVTVSPRTDCDCRWCTTSPRRDGSLLVDRFHYASIPTVTRIV